MKKSREITIKLINNKTNNRILAEYYAKKIREIRVGEKGVGGEG